ncbi:PxKF domain-containing protein [Saccharothrix sp. 6-C]|uniref:PxKF domain-containing protein n=1 Tax=Saccharothrix sp. 6-C TaxID=2781735 RepID=UPI001916CF5F|nr:PxKF domain-containing protein [Saccharothrix sp. 6-C]QQQ80211.1 PxKF domain-containing protein [Saccharothrix sp. 6-C]
MKGYRGKSAFDGWRDLVRLRSLRGFAVLGIMSLVLGTSAVMQANAATGAVIDSADCTQNELTANDDYYTNRVSLPFGVNFYGQTFESLFVNNNGNVTFDSPLGTYTPFGLASTSRQIIAPFFADVDTRQGNTVRYGWGNTTYQGHRALCVNWADVGYYNQHTDKLNSFQLLLVQREDAGVGDFDIVFNYDKVQWETGDASGGSGGIGGTPAVAGFSNGTGTPGTSYELPGSMVSGAFLDSSPTGLARTSTDSPVVGRHVFRVRAGGAPLTDYVALGDSFQSGEGAGDYIAPTDSGANHCHRSTHAYPRQLLDRGVVHLTLDFGACSGAVINDLSVTSSPDRPPYNDGIAQLDRLGPSTKLVTIGIGGNDMQFSDILSGCILNTVLDRLNPFSDTSCQQRYADQLERNFTALVGGGRLRDIYQELRERAPFARIVVVTYPRFYVNGGAGNRYTDDYCAGVRRTDQRWINAGIRRLDDAIRDAAGRLGLQVVDIYDAPEGRELCGANNDHLLNGIRPLNRVESYHPNQTGHTIITDHVARALVSLPPGNLFNVRPGQTINHQFTVSAGPELSVANQWPGSDVVLSLTSPSGRTYTRTTQEANIQHDVGSTFESYHIANPEPGTWTATLFGRVVAPEGEESRLTVHNPPAPNALPTASFTQTLSGRTVAVDAGASRDPDGNLVEYVWDFGDGTTATGSRVTHTYTTPDKYLTTLAVKDDRGGEAFTSATTTVTISKYEFAGFKAPVDNPPTVNTMQAGRAVPLKFGLGGDHGLGVLAPGSPSSVQIDCNSGDPVDEVETTTAAGGSMLTYDPTTGLYQYVWKTESSWAGTCRRLVLTLDDGSTHDAVFRFRR